MGDLLSKAMEGVTGAMAPDPNNPFPVPSPSLPEYLSAFVGGLGQSPRAGPVTRGLGAVSSFAGQEMARRRTDPLGRALSAAQAGIEAAKGITVPVPGQTLTVGGPVPTTPPPGLFQARPPTEFPEEPPQFDTPATTRAPRSMTEILANARSPLDSRMIMAGRIMGIPEDTYFTKPEPFQFGPPGSAIFQGGEQKGQVPSTKEVGREKVQGYDPKTKEHFQIEIILDPITGREISRRELPGTRQPAQFPPQRAPQTQDEIDIDKARLRALKDVEAKRERQAKGTYTLPEAKAERIQIMREAGNAQHMAVLEDKFPGITDNYGTRLNELNAFIDSEESKNRPPTMPGAGGQNDPLGIRKK